MKKATLAAASLASVALPAHAHHFMDGGLPQTFTEGLLSGLGHPVIGPDHAAFIVAAGFFLALVRRGLWGVAALIAGSVLGAALHLNGVALPGLETGIALTVIVVGCLLMVRRPIGLAWMAGGLALAGVLHGYAFAETIFGAEPAPLGAYLIGFSFMQLAIASAAFVLHRRLIATRPSSGRPLASTLGVAVWTIGAAFLMLNVAS